MTKRNYIMTLIVGASLITGIVEAGQEISAKAEIWYEQSKNLDDNKGDGKITANELYVNIDGTYEKEVKTRIMFDGADMISSDGETATEKVVEEAYVQFDEVGGIPLTVILGKDEMPFGQDRDKALTDALHHIFEIDKVWGLSGKLEINEVGSIAAASYFHRNRIKEGTERVAADNEIGDNYCARLKVDKLIDDLSMELSFGQQSYAAISSTDADGATTIREKDNETRLSVGAIYQIGSGNVNAEYIVVSNRKGTPGYDPGLISVGLEQDIYGPVSAKVKFEKILEDASEDVEEDFITVALIFAVAEKADIHLEYANFNSVNYKDLSDLKVADGSLENSIKIGFRGRW